MNIQKGGGLAAVRKPSRGDHRRGFVSFGHEKGSNWDMLTWKGKGNLQHETV